MKPEPFAWAYQNANTEHQYLIWHKQEGGRNWMPLFTLQDVQEAIFAEREACAKVAKAISDKYGWGHYGNEVDTADEIAAAIRARGETK